MGFIHGEVSWVDPVSVSSAAVGKMLAVVEHYPWTSQELRSHESATVCVVASQGTLGDTAVPSGPGPAAEDIELALDVRLHDREALASALGLSVPEVRKQSDAWLLERAYRRWGVGLSARLLGEGAFALWDARAQALLCWRDPLGVRPLYYFHEPGARFVFSSDLQSIAAHPAVRGRLDLAYVRGLLDSGRRLMHPTRTLVAGVKKLAAAHHILVGRDGIKLYRYWHPDRESEARVRADGDYVEELRSLVEEAVRCRMHGSGKHVGAHLTGGLDSSSIAVLAARALDGQSRPLRAFSWAPSWTDQPEVDRDERHLVEAVAVSAPIEMRYAHLRSSDILDVICRDFALKPMTTLRNELATSRDAAAIGVQTILSGWGGDETVAYNGRGYFAALARRGRFLTIDRELRKRAAIHQGSLLGAWKSRVLMPLLPDRALQTLGWLDAPAPAVWPGELRPEFVRMLQDVEPLESPLLRERPGVRQTQLLLLDHGHLQYRMESWASHGASLGITYAFPLLDRRLVEFALSIPDRLYFNDGWKRWLYRTAMQGVLPDDVRWNPHKFDEAMIHEYRRVKASVFDEYLERLRERPDSPLVDLSVLLGGAEGRPPYDEEHDVERAPIGDAAWMAFTELQP